MLQKLRGVILAPRNPTMVEGGDEGGHAKGNPGRQSTGRDDTWQMGGLGLALLTSGQDREIYGVATAIELQVRAARHGHTIEIHKGGVQGGGEGGFANHSTGTAKVVQLNEVIRLPRLLGHSLEVGLTYYFNLHFVFLLFCFF